MSHGWLERSARRSPGQSSSLRWAARLVPDHRLPGSFKQASGVRQHLDDDVGSRRGEPRMRPLATNRKPGLSARHSTPDANTHAGWRACKNHRLSTFQRTQAWRYPRARNPCRLQHRQLPRSDSSWSFRGGCCCESGIRWESGLGEACPGRYRTQYSGDIYGPKSELPAYYESSTVTACIGTLWTTLQQSCVPFSVGAVPLASTTWRVSDLFHPWRVFHLVHRRVSELHLPRIHPPNEQRYRCRQGSVCGQGSEFMNPVRCVNSCI